MGQKLSSKLLFMYSPNSDGFCIFHFFHKPKQGSVATQSGVVVCLVITLFTNFPQSAPVKNFCESVDIWQGYEQNFVLLFGPPCVYLPIVELFTDWLSRSDNVKVTVLHRQSRSY